MAEAFKKLAQGRLPVSGGTTKLYDVPSSTEGIIKTINISNNTASAREVHLFAVGNGGSPADDNLILPGISLGAGCWADWDGTMTLEALTEIHGYAAVTDVISYTIWGIEIS
jgi:hypothetical protein